MAIVLIPLQAKLIHQLLHQRIVSSRLAMKV